MSDGFHKRTWCVARKPHHCDECNRGNASGLTPSGRPSKAFREAQR